MNWEQVDSLLKLHIQTKPKLENGLEDIRNLLSKDNNQLIIENINLSNLKSEFFQYLENAFKWNPIPNNIKSIYFGLFTMDDNGKKVPFEMKKGDRVLVTKYGGTEIKLEGKEFKILNSEDVLAVIG